MDWQIHNWFTTNKVPVVILYCACNEREPLRPFFDKLVTIRIITDIVSLNNLLQDSWSIGH